MGTIIMTGDKRQHWEYRGCKVAPVKSTRPIQFRLVCRRRYWCIEFPDRSWVNVEFKADATTYIDKWWLKKKDNTMNITLTDPMGGTKTVKCRITADSSGIYIRPEGYGDCDTAAGDGCPVIIEFFNKELRVVIWPEINSDNIDVISLEGAREDARETDDNNDNPESEGDTDR